MSAYEKGLSGENQAEKYLCAQGMVCLARRYRAEDGEIDLVMADEETVVFVEVKARPKQSAGMGLEAITFGKQRRITHAALAYLLEHDLMERQVRFDVIEINRDGLLHIPDAFPAQP